MTQYSYAQLEGLWNQAGGNPSLAPTMAAIAEAESSGNSTAVNHNSNGTTDEGLWQINTVWGSLQTFDPLGNAKAAVHIQGAQGLSAWSTYNSGAYKQFMNGATTPDTNTGGSGGSGTVDNTGEIAASQAAECIIALPNVDAASNLPLIGGLFPSTSVCLFSKSQARAVLGGLMMIGAGVVGIVAVGVLVKSISSGNTGVHRAAGSVSDMFKGTVRGQNPVPSEAAPLSPAEELAQAHTSQTYKAQPFKPETGRARPQGGSAGNKVTDALSTPWTVGTPAPKRKTTGSSPTLKAMTAGPAKGTAKDAGKAAASKGALSMDSLVSDARILALAVPK